jgi:hypothetical protein
MTTARATLARTGALLDQLVAIGVYGATHADVLEYLMVRGLDDLIRAGVITIPLPAAPQEGVRAGDGPGSAVAPLRDDVLPAAVDPKPPVAPPAANAHAAEPGTKPRKWTPERNTEFDRDWRNGVARTDMARKYGTTVGAIAVHASERKLAAKSKPGAIAPADKATAWPQDQREKIARLWKAGEAIKDIADDLRLPPAKVIAAVGQLGLTNDMDRRAAMNGDRR